MTRQRLTTAAVWLALVTALVASYSHVARALLVLEPDGSPWPAYLGAAGIDAGLVALVATSSLLVARGARRARYLLAVAVFVAISAAANADAALVGLLGERVTMAAIGQLDALDAARALIFAAALPMLVLILANAAEDLAGSAPAPEAAERQLDLGAVADPELPEALPDPALAWGATEARANGRDRHNGRQRDAAAELRDRFLQLALDNPTRTQTSIAADLDRGKTWAAETVARLRADGRLVKGPEGWTTPEPA